MRERSDNPRSEASITANANPDSLLVRPAKDRTQTLGRTLVTHFYMLAKTAGMFDFTNVITKEAVGTFLKTLKGFYTEDSVATLQLASECLFANETRLKIDFEAFASFKYVVEALKQREIGGIAFQQGVSELDLETFLGLFDKSLQPDQCPRERIQAGLQAAGVSTIWLEEPKDLSDRPSSAEVSDDYRDVSVNTYFKSIFVAKQFMENMRGTRVTHFQKARRLVHSIVDVVAEDDSTLLALTQIKNFDDFLFTHSANVCVLAVSLGQQLGMDKLMLGSLGLAGLLHDVGMTEMPPELARTEGLTSDNQALYELHPAIGARILLRNQGVSDASIRCVLAAFEHHLNEDFSGFPSLKRSRSVSLIGRIVALVDFYDKVTTPGANGTATFSPEDTLRLMAHEGSELFDPLLLKVFVNTVGIYPLGTVVKLDSGETGIVYRRNPHFSQLARPLVKIVSNELGMPTEPRVVDLSEFDRKLNRFTRTVTETLPPSSYFEHAQEYADLL